jgi:transposase
MYQQNPGKWSRVRERLIEAVRNGCSRTAAAAAAGLDRHTLYGWLRQGREDPDSPFGELNRALEAAEAEFEATQIKVIAKAAQGGELIKRVVHKDGTVEETYARAEWTAAAWLLERKWPERYGMKSRPEIEVRRRLLIMSERLGVPPVQLLEEAVQEAVLGDAQEIEVEEVEETDEYLRSHEVAAE